MASWRFAFECVNEACDAPAKAFDLSLSVTAHLASMAGSRERAIGRAKSDLVGLATRSAGVRGTSGYRGDLRVGSLRSTGYTGSSMSKSAGPFHRFHHEHRFRIGRRR